MVVMVVGVVVEAAVVEEALVVAVAAVVTAVAVAVLAVEVVATVELSAFHLLSQHCCTWCYTWCCMSAVADGGVSTIPSAAGRGAAILRAALAAAARERVFADVLCRRPRRHRIRPGIPWHIVHAIGTWVDCAKSEADPPATGCALASAFLPPDTLLPPGSTCEQRQGSRHSFFFFFYYFLVVTRGTLLRVETPGSKHTSLQARSEHPRWIPITFLLTTGGETRAKHFCFPFEGTHDREISGEGRHPSLKI